MAREIIRTCPLCEASCGLRLRLDDSDRVTAVRGDRDDVLSRGYLCPKGARLGALDEDPDRRRRPAIRRDGRFVDVPWEDALAEVAAGLARVRERHGPEAVGVYFGNPTAHTIAGHFYLRPFISALGTPNVYSAASVDQLPKHVSSGYVFGDPTAVPVPDIDRTGLLVIIGANPRVSNGSLWTAPDLPGRLDALRARGGKLIVVDPKRTRTAARADLHLAVRPGSDAALLAAVLHTLDEEGEIRLGAVARQVRGMESLLAAAAKFAPERVAERCGVPEAAIRNLARELASADRACVYGRMGTTTSAHGTLTSWLIDVLNVVTGNLDRAGGVMFPRPAHHKPPRRGEFRTGRWHSRVRNMPEAIGELPVATLLDELQQPGPGQLRALFTVAGNPVISTPRGDRLEPLLADLELLVSVDPYVNATTQHAHVLLPPPRTLQRSHYDLPLYGFAIRNVANYSPAALPLDADQLDEWEILLALRAVALGRLRPLASVDEEDTALAHAAAERILRDLPAPAGALEAADVLRMLRPRTGPERLLDLSLRAGPYGDHFGAEPDGLTLDQLERSPHGMDFGALEPRIGDVLGGPDPHIDLAPEPFVAALNGLASELREDGVAQTLLIGRRSLRTNNSWSHNDPALTRGELCTLQIHPVDARTRGLLDGQKARVTAAAGTVEVTVEITDDLRPGVVSLPHGFGQHGAGIELRHARTLDGVNSNILTDGFSTDPLSGTAVLNGIPVTITPLPS